MVLVRNSAASLAVAGYLVAAMPADPIITIAPALRRRSDANVVGYSADPTSGWDTRTCNNGFFSTSAGLGNCCDSSDCNFITACVGVSLYYVSGDPYNCGGPCATGTIYLTAGDPDPMHMYNCDGDWVATRTVTTVAPAYVPTTSSAEPQTTTIPASVQPTTILPPATSTAAAIETTAVVATTAPVETTAQVPTTTLLPNTVHVETTASGAATTQDLVLTSQAQTSVGESTTSAAISIITYQNTQADPVTVVVTATNPAGQTGTGTAINTASTTPQSANSASPNTTSKSTNKAIIAGSAVGAAAVIVLIALLAFFLYKYKKNKKVVQEKQNVNGAPPPLQPYAFNQPNPIGAAPPPVADHSTLEAYQQNQWHGAPMQNTKIQDWRGGFPAPIHPKIPEAMSNPVSPIPPQSPQPQPYIVQSSWSLPLASEVPAQTPVRPWPSIPQQYGHELAGNEGHYSVEMPVEGPRY